MFTHIQERQVTRPSVSRIRSTILDHATVTTSTERFDLVNEGGLWPSYNCLDTLIPTALCPDPTEDKEFDFIGWIPAFSFAVYAGVQCNLVGLDRDDQKREVKRVFEANEGKGIERALLANRFVERLLDDTRQVHRRSEWEAPVDLTATLAPEQMKPKMALALLEGYARQVYAGQPTIHMPAGMAAHLSGEGIVWEGSGDNAKAFTPLGSKVAIGGGYDPSYEPWDGTWTAYATGEVYVEQGPEVEIQQFELNGSTVQTGRGIDSNTSLTLVERPYRAAVDCFVAKATATFAV